MDLKPVFSIGAPYLMYEALWIKPRFSFLLCLFFCVVYALGFVCLTLARMTIYLHFLLEVFVVVHFVYVMRRYVFYSHPLSIKRLWCDKEGRWKMQCCDAHIREGTLLQSVMFSRYFIFLAFRLPDHFFPITVPLALDSEAPANMRRLRQFLLKHHLDEEVAEQGN